MPEKPPHHEEDNQWIAEQILQHRKKMGMTQTDLATEIGDPRYQKYISDSNFAEAKIEREQAKDAA